MQDRQKYYKPASERVNRGPSPHSTELRLSVTPSAKRGRLLLLILPRLALARIALPSFEPVERGRLANSSVKRLTPKGGDRPRHLAEERPTERPMGRAKLSGSQLMVSGGTILAGRPAAARVMPVNAHM